MYILNRKSIQSWKLTQIISPPNPNLPHYPLLLLVFVHSSE